MKKPHKVALFGLGSMGMGMAKSLLAAGHCIVGFDLAKDRVSELVAAGGQAGNADNMPCDLDAVVTVVVNAIQTQNVLFGPTNAIGMLRPGGVVISCATVPPEFSINAGHECSLREMHFLDAPISGGAARAAAGTLSIMASGSPDAFAASRPFLNAMAETVFELGDKPGVGSAMKSVNQLLAGVHIAAMAEAMTFGMKLGVSPKKFMEVIPKCAGTSWMLENRAPHVLDGDYAPRSTVTIWPKDLGIIRDIAEAVGIDTPIAMAALKQFQAAVDLGLGQEDDAAIAKVYAEAAGLTLPDGAN